MPNTYVVSVAMDPLLQHGWVHLTVLQTHCEVTNVNNVVNIVHWAAVCKFRVARDKAPHSPKPWRIRTRVHGVCVYVHRRFRGTMPPSMEALRRCCEKMENPQTICSTRFADKCYAQSVSSQHSTYWGRIIAHVAATPHAPSPIGVILHPHSRRRAPSAHQ